MASTVQNAEGGGSLEEEEDDEGESSSLLESTPLKKCEKHHGVRGVCCRDLKQDQRHLIDPDVVRDVIIGLSDGLTVPFALTAGLAGVGDSRIVVLAGLAELVSGAISMGVGGLLSAQAELSHYNFVSRQTAARVSQSCFGEMEREVCTILEPFGVPTEVGAMVAAKLQSVEVGENLRRSVESGALLPTPVNAPVPPKRRSDGLIGPERGLTPFLLRLGEGLEKIEESRVWQSALIIGSSYFIGGFIPLLPYILLSSVRDALMLSIAVTGAVLLLFGVVKQSCTGGQNDWKGLLYGAFSTLFVGAAAAGSSWAIVRLLEGNSSL
ncbi:hypothetical protein CBS101457_003538 [Exobasidium rhododendri]|nr:hypothetical protein CBS101457_003538 [Exobasidium rhododendri]